MVATCSKNAILMFTSSKRGVYKLVCYTVIIGDFLIVFLIAQFTKIVELPLECSLCITPFV